MDQQWSAPGWVVVGVLVVLLAVLATGLLARRRARLESAEARAELARLTARITAVEQQAARPARGEPDWVITHLGEPDGYPVETGTELTPITPTLPTQVFADLVLRETVVQAGALVGGVRRVLGPESRNRIRFAYRTEVKRSRRQRRADLRAARREWETRRREAA